MRILVTGASGMLGSSLIYYFKDRYQLTGWYYQHSISPQGASAARVDLTDLQNVKKALSGCGPDVIIHCAALTNVDECEAKRELAYMTNVKATENLVKAVDGSKVKFIYISTDSVYDGAKAPFTEADEANPVNYYGVTKLKGEEAALRLKDSLIIRTNIFGWNIQDKYKQSLGEWVLNNLKEGRKILGFKDVFFCSIYTSVFCGVLEEIIKKDIRGLYNVASSDYCSKYEFAVSIAKRFGYDPALIKAGSISEGSLAAKRPKSLILDVSRIERLLGRRMPSIQESIEAFFQDYNSGLPQRLKGETGVRI